MKISYFLIWVGVKGHDIMNTWTLAADEAKKLKTYFDKYKEYVSPKSNEVFARYKFHAQVQEGDKPFESFVTDLKLLVQDCAYNDSDQMVRDRILFGINNSHIREKLINKGNELTLSSAIEIAQTYEVSRQQLKTMDGSRDNVHTVRKKVHRTQGAKDKELRVQPMCK